MQETRSGIDARRKLARWSAVFAVTALVVVGCTNSAASSAPAASTAPTAAPASEAPASVAPASQAPASQAATSHKIGYISLGDSVPFVKLVSDGIKDAAAAAGQELLFCDSEIDAAKALACAQNLKVQGAEGVLNFQVFQDSSPEICAAYGSVPTMSPSFWCNARVRYWHLADIDQCTAHVRFRGQSGHAFLHCICPLMTQSGHWLCAAATVMWCRLTPLLGCCG